LEGKSSVSEAEPKKKSCCDMRRKIAIGIAKVFSEDECGIPDSAMLDFHNFNYSSPTKLPVAVALAFKFCPWCGARRDNSNMERRATEVIRPLRSDADDDVGEAWKGGTPEEEE
jgi:hypothetical protein